MAASPRALLALHLAVLLFGTAGVFGKFLAVPAVVLVFGRTLFATLGLTAWLALRRELTMRGLRPGLLLCGVLLAAHWLSFFQAVLESSVAVGLMGFASFPVFVTWLEPWWFKEPRRRSDILAALAVVVGLWLLVPPGDWSGRTAVGLGWGIVSGFTFALLAMANRVFARDVKPVRLAWVQNGSAMLVLLPFVSWPLSLSASTWLGLALLGVVCTALSHSLFMFSLSRLPARLASVTTALEPVYGILLALIWLDEWPGVREWAGCAVILGATTLATWWHGRVSSPAPAS